MGFKDTEKIGDVQLYKKMGERAKPTAIIKDRNETPPVGCFSHMQLL